MVRVLPNEPASEAPRLGPGNANRRVIAVSSEAGGLENRSMSTGQHLHEPIIKDEEQKGQKQDEACCDNRTAAFCGPQSTGENCVPKRFGLGGFVALEGLAADLAGALRSTSQVRECFASGTELTFA